MRSGKLSAALLAATVALSCSSSPGSNVDVPGMIHIHGLGVNPSDETLYVATHYGLFRVIPGEDPQRVGESVQDFMGFAVVGADHFLASGHPGAADHRQPPNLGLIESTDAGRTWNSLSLSGDADFHALEHRHDRVYGHDSQSGQILISTDKRTWARRASIRALDLAVSPDDRAEMLVTTPEGLQRSRDDAATFDAVATAPTLMHISWPDSGPLIGIGPSGILWTSTDAGATWQSRHALNQTPQALLAAVNGRVLVATETMVYGSSDNAATVEPLTPVN